MAAETRRSFVKRAAAAGAGAALGMAAAKPAGQALGANDMFRARFAVCNEMFGDWPFDRAFALAAACGYQGVEIAPFTIANNVTDIPTARRTEIRRQAEKAGLKVAGLHWLLAKTKGFHLTHPDTAVRRKTAEYLAALARFCGDLGGKLLIFGSPQQRNLRKGVDREQGTQHAVEVVRAALPALEKADVTLAMEPLSPKITNFLSTAAEAVDLIKRIDSPRCRLILDCNAMATESSPHADLIRRHRQWLVHFHANDPNSQGPGFGDLDFVPILAALRDIAYSGWISVEVFDYAPGPERLARESIRYMKECLAKPK